jgi:hypothetical protein
MEGSPNFGSNKINTKINLSLLSNWLGKYVTSNLRYSVLIFLSSNIILFLFAYMPQN